jgi:hypothetical protein
MVCVWGGVRTLMYNYTESIYRGKYPPPPREGNIDYHMDKKYDKREVKKETSDEKEEKGKKKGKLNLKR